MKQRKPIAIAVALISLLLGGTIFGLRSSEDAPSPPVISAEVDEAVNNSSSVRHVRAISPVNACWFVDGTNGGYPVIYVGFDEGWHTTRSATLRVREHGIIERQEMQDDGELIWVPDGWLDCVRTWAQSSLGAWP